MAPAEVEPVFLTVVLTLLTNKCCRVLTACRAAPVLCCFHRFTPYLLCCSFFFAVRGGHSLSVFVCLLLFCWALSLIWDAQSAVFPETMCKAGWSKEHTIDALFRKAGYWKPRGDFSGVPGDSAPGNAAMAAATTSATAALAATTTNSSTVITDDPAVSRSTVFLRFQTVTHRMNFSKYQRASKKREET